MFPPGRLAAWRRPILCVTAGFVGTLLVLSAVTFYGRGPTTGTPRAVAPASSAPPAQELPDPSYPQDTPDDGDGDPELEAGPDASDGSVPLPEPEPEPPAVGSPPRNPLRSTPIGNTRPVDPLPDDPAAALAVVARRIDQAAARGQVSVVGEIVLRKQVRKIARALDGPRLGLGLRWGIDGRGVDSPRLAAAIGGLRTTVAGLALFRRIAPEAAASIRSAADQLERTVR